VFSPKRYILPFRTFAFDLAVAIGIGDIVAQVSVAGS
jgi:hypothetical protein